MNVLGPVLFTPFTGMVSPAGAVWTVMETFSGWKLRVTVVESRCRGRWR